MLVLPQTQIDPRPSWEQGVIRTAAESAYPNLWDQLVCAWAPALGPTGAKVHDLSGRYNDGTMSGMDPATDWVMTDQGWALDFDGVDDVVNMPTMSTGSYGLTIAMNIRYTDAAVYRYFGGFSVDNGNFIALRKQAAATTLNFFGKVANGTRINILAEGHSPPYFLVGTLDTVASGGVGKLYVDGVEVGTEVTSGSFGGFVGYSLGGLTWRDTVWNDVMKVPFMGVWHRALSASEVQQLYVNQLAWALPRRTLPIKAAVAPSAAAKHMIMGGGIAG